MAPGAKRKSFDHALASFPVPGGGGAAAGGVGGLDAWVLEGREEREEEDAPKSRDSIEATPRFAESQSEPTKLGARARSPATPPEG